MRTGKLVLSGVLICLAVLMFAIVGSCGKGKARAPTVAPTATVPAQRETSRRIPPLDELLRELENLKKPPNTDREVWAAMKKDMREWLIETFGDGKGGSRYAGEHLEPPAFTGTHDYVKARDLKWKPYGVYGALTWRYVNDGDYNQDSLVAIADMTPLAAHYGEQVSKDPANDNPILELIDEDDDLANR